MEERFHPGSPSGPTPSFTIVGFVLYKQFTGQFASTGTREITLLAGELVLAVGLGVARGRAIRLETRDGWLYPRGSVALLAAWVATIAVRVGASLLGDGAGAAALVTTSSALVIGASLAVQGLVLRRRVAADGRPLRPVTGRGAARASV